MQFSKQARKTLKRETGFFGFFSHQNATSGNNYFYIYKLLVIFQKIWTYLYYFLISITKNEVNKRIPIFKTVSET